MTNSETMTSFCITDRQREIVQLHESGMSKRAIGRKLGLNESTVRKSIARVETYAASKGFAPKYGMTKTVPDPFVVKGTSTLYDSDGVMRAQWVKTAVDQNRARELVKQLCDEYMRSIPKFRPPKKTKPPKGGYAKKLVVYPIADAHIGMLSWKPETGSDYDVKIAEQVICDTMTKVIDGSEACEECVIENLGDWLHVDNQFNRTERSGNNLDVDGRYAKLLQCGIRVLRYCIEYASEKHRRVTVINCMGNHDDIGSLWLTAALKNIYEKSGNIVVQDGPSPRHYFEYGNTIIGCTHGSDAKPDMLPIVMASEKPEKWGQAKFRYWHIGHIHHDSMIEIGDCKVESFRAICAKDAWTNSRGYMSGRDVKALFFDREHGEVERHTVCIV